MFMRSLKAPEPTNFPYSGPFWKGLVHSVHVKFTSLFNRRQTRVNSTVLNDWVKTPHWLLAGETLNYFRLTGFSKWDDGFHWEQRSSRRWKKTITKFDVFHPLRAKKNQQIYFHSIGATIGINWDRWCLL